MTRRNLGGGAVLAWLSLLLMAGCGTSGGPGSEVDGHMAAVAGTYAVDLDRSIAAIPPSGITPSAAAERDTRLRTAFAPDAYSLELQPEGTFRMTIRRDPTTHVFTGTSSATEDTVELTVTAVDGEALPSSGRVLDVLARDGDDLVLTDGGRTIYLTPR
jgi:hypothetical protein